MRVAVDLDGVLAEYDPGKAPYGYKIGYPIPGAKEFVKILKGLNCEIIVYTARLSDDAYNVMYEQKGDDIGGRDSYYSYMIDCIDKWLEYNRIDVDGIYCSKPVADYYIDDKAIECRPQENGRMAFNAVLAKIQGW